MSRDGLNARTRTAIVAAAVAGMTLAGLAPAAAQPEPRPHAMRSFLFEHAKPIVQGVLGEDPASAAVSAAAGQPIFDWDRIKKELLDSIEPDS